MRIARSSLHHQAASRSPEVLRGLVDAGMNVARINFAHGTDVEHRENVGRVRAASAEAGRPVAILQDLSGPKIRLGELVPANVTLETGARIVLACGKDKGDAAHLPVPDDYLAAEARPGAPILLGDGAVELEIEDVDGTEIHCRVVLGGPISSGKGVNAPGAVSSRPILSERDQRTSSSAPSWASTWSACRTCGTKRTSRRCAAR
jgi:pyruvate kinase